MEIADWARDPDILFDQPEEESSAPLIPLGQSNYNRHVYHLQEYHTGSREAFLSSQECYDLGLQMQSGKIAQERLDAIAAEGKRVWGKTRERLETEAADGRAAREKLIESNLRLAAHMARLSMNIGKDEESVKRMSTFGDITKLQSRHASLEDRIQVANLGLVRAADGYTPKRDRRGRPIGFAGFARWHIHNELQRYVLGYEANGFRTPEHALEEMGNARHHPNEFSDQALQRLSHWAINRYAEYAEETHSNHFVPEEVEDYEEPTELPLAEVVPSDDISVEAQAMNSVLRRHIGYVFNTLSEREAYCIAGWYGLPDDQPLTLDTMGKDWGVTRERIRQLVSKAMAQIRHPSRLTYLSDQLGIDMSGQATFEGMRPAQIVPGIGHITTQRLLASSESEQRLRNHVERYKKFPGESWQAFEGEDWNIPVRKTAGELADLYDRAGWQLSRILRSADSQHFTFSRSEEEAGSYLPIELFEEINEASGLYLRAYHIEEYWNKHLDGLVARLEHQAGDDFSLDRVSLLFSYLLREHMVDDDIVELKIPKSLQGRLDMFGTELQCGTVIVNGDLGNFVGNRLNGVARLVVNGSVGDYAGSEMEDYSYLEVNGNAGNELGYASTNGGIVVNGYAESLALRPKYIGDVTVQRVGTVAVGAPSDHYSVLVQSATSG